MSALSAASPPARFRPGSYLDELFGGGVSANPYKDQSRQLGRRIKERRETLGLRVHDLANRMDVVDVTVSKWERGENRPREIAQLAAALETTPEYLLYGEDRDLEARISEVDARVRRILEILEGWPRVGQAEDEGQR